MADDCDLYEDFDFGPVEVVGGGVATSSKAGCRAVPPAKRAPAAAAATAATAATDLDLDDLYDDLEAPAGGGAGNDDDTEDSADYDVFQGSSAKGSRPAGARPAGADGSGGAAADGEAMRALLEVLRAAGDDEVDGPPAGGAAAQGRSRAGAETKEAEDFLLCDDDLYGPVAPSAFKKPRLDQDGGGGGLEPPVLPAAAPAAAESADAEFDFEADLPAESDAGAALQQLPGHDRSGGSAAARRQEQRGGSGSSYWFNPMSKRWEAGPAPAWAEQQSPDGCGGAGAYGGGYGGCGYGGKGGQAAFGGRGGKGGKLGRGAAGRGGFAGGGPGRGGGGPPSERLKSTMCRNFLTGSCRWGEQCYFAHGEADLQEQSKEVVNKRYVFQVMIEATNDVKQGLCDKTQALAVRLALKFEDRPEDIFTCMETAGLPTGADQRTTVKALLRLCHPDKCKHPEAKKAAAILGPLLSRGTAPR